eukprot:1733742-Pleurochrysis_carterae.AAC.1
MSAAHAAGATCSEGSLATGECKCNGHGAEPAGRKEAEGVGSVSQGRKQRAMMRATMKIHSLSKQQLRRSRRPQSPRNRGRSRGHTHQHPLRRYTDLSAQQQLPQTVTPAAMKPLPTPVPEVGQVAANLSAQQQRG